MVSHIDGVDNPGAGTEYSVEAANSGTQSAGGIAGLLGQEVEKARGPNTAAYSAQMNDASRNASQYYQLGQNYTQQGPTIANQFQDESRQNIHRNISSQEMLAEDLLNNKGEASRAQFQSQLNQGIAAQMAVANSARGGAVAAAGARRQAAADAANMRLQGASQAAALGAQEREQAQGLAAGLYGQVGSQLQGQYGLEQGSAISQGQLDSANQAQQNQMRQGYANLGVQSAGQAQNALNSYTSQNLAAQGLSAGLQQQAQASTNQLIGTAAGVAGTMMGGPAGGAAATAAAGAMTGGSGPPKYARGGAFDGTHPILVGEEGPELIMPQRPGYVMTAQQTAALRGAPPTGQQAASIAALYGSNHTGPGPAQRPSLAEALVGVEHLKAAMGGRNGN